MLLRNKNPLVILGSGQIFMVLGLIGIHILRPETGGYPDTFWGSFGYGLAYGFLGISMVLNLVGIIRIRRQAE